MYTFNHFNFNVADLEKSIAFYQAALGLHEVRRREDPDHRFIIVYLGDGTTGFQLELTWLNDHPQAYDLGECEFHLAVMSDDYERSFAEHTKNGWVCFVNEAMGIYFIEDPDGYWIEIIPSH